MLGHQMLTDRPVDEAAPGCIGVEVGDDPGCSDVVDRDLPGRAQLRILGGDVVFPRPDSGDGWFFAPCRAQVRSAARQAFTSGRGPPAERQGCGACG